MPSKKNDWLSEALDRHPAEPVPQGFAESLKERLGRDFELKPHPAQDFEEPSILTSPRFQRWAKPFLATAAAALLLGIGFMLGAGSGTGFGKIELDPGGQLAETEIEEIYQNRELLLSWDLISDQELELSFRQLEDEEAGWLDDLATPTDSGDASTTIKSPAELKGPAGEK